jgi:hypothetical protein
MKLHEQNYHRLKKRGKRESCGNINSSFLLCPLFVQKGNQHKYINQICREFELFFSHKELIPFKSFQG